MPSSPQCRAVQGHEALSAAAPASAAAMSRGRVCLWGAEEQVPLRFTERELAWMRRAPRPQHGSQAEPGSRPCPGVRGPCRETQGPWVSSHAAQDSRQCISDFYKRASGQEPRAE